MLLLQKDYDSLKAQMIVNIFFFSNKVFQVMVCMVFLDIMLLTHLIDYTIV